MDSTETAQKPNIAPPPHHKQSRGGRIALVAAGVIAVIALVAFIASFFLDGMIGPRIQSAMNSRLKGYHVTLGKVHLQLVGMRLTLKKLVILQEAHPNPPRLYLAAHPAADSIARGSCLEPRYRSASERPCHSRRLRL